MQKGECVMEESRGFTIKDLLIRLILIIVFVFLLIWLFPMPDLKPLNNQIFADNVDRMKDVAKSYYTIERLPSNINDSKKMTLKEMLDKKLILPLMDSNGEYCSEEDSYVEITKMENEYVIKVYLSCSDKQDYIITHFGCYDICTNECKVLETTTYNYTPSRTTTVGTSRKTTTQRPVTTTTTTKRITTSKTPKIYEYEFVKNVCTDVFDKYVCPVDYDLIGDSCIKKGSKTITVDAREDVKDVVSTDTKPAKPVITNEEEKFDATCEVKELTSTVDANPSSVTVDKIHTTKNVKVTADKINSYDVKGAVVTTVYADYIAVQNYDIKTADLLETGYKWEYSSTITSNDPGKGKITDTEKIILVNSWTELACDTCSTTQVVYEYWKYVKKPITEYSCSRFSGYTLYDGNKCRKYLGTSKKCPSGYKDSGSSCYKEGALSCSKYGKDYKLNESAKTCTKTTTTYSCPAGTSPTSEKEYCTKQVTGMYCPEGTTELNANQCSKVEYTCPADTKYVKYTQVGNKCIKKSQVKVCSCPEGSTQTEDKLHCVKNNEIKTYTCEDYPDYKLMNTNQCVKEVHSQVKVYGCDDDTYTLNEETKKCVKTVEVTDTKKAEKTYKPLCKKEYIWSTNTSLDGWTYTGNKREIN